MSYTKMIKFECGEPKTEIRYGNSWGGAARIWNALFDKYLKDPKIPYDTWLSGGERAQALWDLTKREDLTTYERAVHISTFDRAFVLRKDFARFCADLRAFDTTYPAQQCVSHLVKWAKDIERCDAKTQAVAFCHNSISENPWLKQQKDDGELFYRHLSDGFDVYKLVEQQSKKKENKT